VEWAGFVGENNPPLRKGEPSSPEPEPGIDAPS